jgi:hypothetical protein
MADGGAVASQEVVDAALADAREIADSVPTNEATVLQEQAEPNSLQAQIANLRRAEQHRDEMERQRARQAPPQLATVAGPEIQLTDAEQQLNTLYPQLMTDPAAANIASATIGVLQQQGVQRGSVEYESRLRPVFESILEESRRSVQRPQPEMLAAEHATAPASVAAPVMASQEPPPSFQRPPLRAPAAQAEPMPAPRVPVSAPVSRDPPSPTTGRAASETRVVLSAAEREIAKLSGISEFEFAKNKLRLAQLKQGGFYQED